MAPGPTADRTDVRRRLRGVAAVASFVVALLVSFRLRTAPRIVLAWDLATLVWLALTWRSARAASAAETRSWARLRGYRRSRRDRTLAVGFSLFGLAFALGLSTLARRPTGPVDHLEIGLSALAVVLAWLALNAAYAAHYAALYYGDRPPEAGLAFPGDEAPARVDFAYFAFTLGTAISTSDVSITSRRFRTTALGHVLLAFAYNTGVLGVVVNVANLYA
ncbi:DUF1345 domain-containing protein [Halorussus sp. AFM4]|uniref:DUF1345 domain-containing protein n=1 Tax=Halorussus sp. AFM4 TaxID=3421651 RepID=UPI003EC0B354